MAFLFSPLMSWNLVLKLWSSIEFAWEDFFVFFAEQIFLLNVFLKLWYLLFLFLRYILAWAVNNGVAPFCFGLSDLFITGIILQMLDILFLFVVWRLWLGLQDIKEVFFWKCWPKHLGLGEILYFTHAWLTLALTFPSLMVKHRSLENLVL